MQLVIRQREHVETYTSLVKMRGKGMFQDKAMRDSIVKLLKQDGILVRTRSIRNQNLHPEYVTDYVGSYHTGFGNTDYMTFFSHLYSVEVVRY